MSDAKAPSTEQLLRIGQPKYGGSFQAETTAPLRAVEVAFTAAGEVVRIALPTEEAGSEVIAAAPDSIVEASAHRVAPRCMHFGVCGGCQYQHLDRGEQLRIKTTILRNTLEQQHIELPPAGIQAHAAGPWHYRNRVRLRLNGGQPGYSKRRSNAFLPIQECPIISPLLWTATEQMRALADHWPQSSSEVEFFAADDDTAMQMALHLDTDLQNIDRDAPKQFRRLCETLSEGLPQFKGAGLLVPSIPSAKTMRRVEQRQRMQVAQWGAPTLHYHVAGQDYAVSRGAFFQVNRFLTNRMVGLVLGRRTGRLAFDLFAGAGLFSLPLTERFAHVVSVEIGEPAASDLRQALRRCGPQHRAEHKTALTFLREWNGAATRSVPDLVVIDPPRSGMGRVVVHELLQLGAKEVVYVSCDPNTFAQDTRALVESRYILHEVNLVDLFPQTFHIETIATLRLR